MFSDGEIWHIDTYKDDRDVYRELGLKPHGPPRRIQAPPRNHRYHARRIPGDDRHPRLNDRAGEIVAASFKEELNAKP